jgi:DNA replication protein DnaC
MKNGKATLCACGIERRVRAALPERYWNATLKDFNGAILELVSDWLLNPSDGLFITGACGTGKTHLAAGIVRHFIHKGTQVSFKRASDFYREVREMFKSQSESAEAAVMSAVERVRFLVFDDLGAGSLSDCERRYTLELLDTRQNKLRPTVVTSNWDFQEIAERMDDRVASRLAGFAALELSGKDKRIRA